MNIMIVVVLAVVWVVALTPMVLRRISERQLTSGVRSYHRRLLRLGSSATATSAPVAGSVPGAMIGFSVAAQRLQDERFGTQTAVAPATGVAPGVSGTSEHLAVLPSASASASPATAARRRQVVTILGGATVLFFLLGLIPSARVMWDLALLTLGCAAAYVALLIHFHRLAVERAQKVIALETRRHVTAALESRRHVIALDRAQQAAVGGGYVSDGYSAGYAETGSSYAQRTGPVLSGSGWSVTGVHTHRATGR